MEGAAHLNIMTESNNYMDDETPVGELQFKLMVKNASIDTGATSNNMREKLPNLDTYMYKVNSNIENFNQYVKVNVDGLKERSD